MKKRPAKPAVKAKAVTYYKTGPKQGLPKNCECGGKMIYSFAFNRVFSGCDTCTPVETIPESIIPGHPTTNGVRKK